MTTQTEQEIIIDELDNISGAFDDLQDSFYQIRRVLLKQIKEEQK